MATRIALKTSELKTEAKDKNSKDDERVGKPTGLIYIG
jgi:hypothetical protein